MTARDRRALLAGAGVVLGAVLALRVVPTALRGVAALRAHAAGRLETLARARDALAGAPAARDSARAELGRIVALAPSLVDGASAAEAQSSLAALVSLAASRQALRLVRVEPVPDSSDGVFQPVAVTAEAEGDVRGLAALLGAVETSETLLTVRTLSVQALDPDAADSGPERLRIELTVAGWYLPRVAGRTR